MKTLRTLLDERFEAYLEPLKELTAIDTQDIGHGILGGREKEGQAYMERLYRALGANHVEVDPMEETVIQEAMDLHDEGNPGHNYQERSNVYATFKGAGGPSLLFNGHVDTMPPGDESNWRFEPFAPTVDQGRLYGLGTADMKAGLMAPAMAIRLIKDAGLDLPGDVILTSVVDEEGGGNGSIQAAMRGLTADAAVVCEPTNRELIVAHMGFVFFEVKVKGRAVHSGSKWLGVSAIDKAVKLIASLDELEHHWLMTYKHPLLPPPSLNVGTISGGTAGSTVAESCTFNCCVHYHPETMDRGQVERAFEEVIRTRSAGDKWLRDHMPEISVYQAGGSFEMDTEHHFVSTFRAAYRESMNSELPLVGSPAGCDSRIWKNIAGIPTVQYGPGRQSECHAINEYVPLDQYKEAILIYAQLILGWGGQNKGGN